MIWKQLKERFIDALVVEDITLHGLMNGQAVSAFKVSKLSAELDASMQELEGVLAAGAEAGEGDAGSPDEVEADAGVEGTTGDDAANAEDDAANAEEEGVDRHQERKNNRAKRQAEMAALVAEKIDDTYQNADHTAEIKYATENMGYFKLKTADDFVVPEHQRVNAEKKRREMVLLETSVYKIKMGFNERFLALRALKARIIEGVKADSKRMGAIDAEVRDL